MRPTLIFDLDGTIADVSYRREVASNAQRDAAQRGEQNPRRFFWKAWQDPLNVATDRPSYVADFLRGIAKTNQYQIIIFSARTMKLYDATVNWLHHFDIPYDQLHMRPEDDFRPDNEFKDDLWSSFSDEFRESVEIIFDDRQQVVDLWNLIKKQDGYMYKVVQVIDPATAKF